MAKKAKKAAKKPAKKAAKKAVKKPAKKAAKKPAKKAAPAEPAQPPKPRHGEFMWNELMTRDDEKALGFFEQLLGWTHQDWPMGPDAVYRLAKNGEKSVAGMMKMTSPQFPDFVPPHWMSYIAVDNVDARFDKAVSLGGEAIHPPTDIPQVGRFCIIKDPSGAAIALMTPEGGTA
jgi:predicted enzyme related to lactoylglutathione lyase